MEPGHVIRRHADQTVPFMLERDLAGQFGKDARESPICPALVNDSAGVAKSAEARKDEPSRSIEADHLKEHPRIPGALAIGQDRLAEFLWQGWSRKVEERDFDLLVGKLP